MSGFESFINSEPVTSMSLACGPQVASHIDRKARSVLGLHFFFHVFFINTKI